MGLYVVSGRTSGAGTTARPSVSLYAPASSGGAIREIGIVNTTALSCVYKVARLTTTGTQGAGLTEIKFDEDYPPPLMTAFDAHSADATVGGAIRQATLGAAVGSGVIWTFGERGLVIPPGTSNGVGIVLVTGTGQILDYHIDWVE